MPRLSNAIQRFEGAYDDVNRLCTEVLGSNNWGFVNINLRTYYAEGSKTVGYEIIEQLGWKAPKNIVVCMASGSLLTKIYKSVKEFEVGLLEHFASKAPECIKEIDDTGNIGDDLADKMNKTIEEFKKSF